MLTHCNIIVIMMALEFILISGLCFGGSLFCGNASRLSVCCVEVFRDTLGRRGYYIYLNWVLYLGLLIYDMGMDMEI